MTSEAAPATLEPFSNGASARNGHTPEPRVVQDSLPSSYLKYLPAIYSEDPFIGRFLRIFEEILSPIQVTVDNRAQHFDPSLAAAPMLQVLASWVGSDLVDRLEESKARRLIRATVELQQARGTKRGLRKALEIVTGRRPYITEYSTGLVLGEDAVLGLNTSLVTGSPLQIQVMFDCQEGEIDTSTVHAIIRRYKPAGTTYSVAFAQ